MKTKLLNVLLFFSTFIAISQEHLDTQVANQTNAVFNLLEKNRIPYSILLDYGYDFVDVTGYNGTLTNDNYITPGVYRNLYNALLSSRINTTVPELVDPTAFDDTWIDKQDAEFTTIKKSGKVIQTPVVVNGLYYKYSKISSTALSQNKIRIVNNGYDDSYINGVWQNPYETGEAFAISLPVTEINNGSISLKLDTDTWYTNQSTAVTAYAVDFGDGSGYKTMNIGQFTSHTYTSDNTYTITFRIRLSNGQYKYCRNKLLVKGTTPITKSAGCPAKVVEITAAREYLGVKGTATLQIDYAGTCGEIRKPLIVAEGLDTNILGGGAFGDTDLIDFKNVIDFSGSQALRNLITVNTSYDYDIIYVNWDNGVDYLERNAYVLEAVINYVNSVKTGNEKNVVLGQSMGGVIARYALKDMENRNENHDTKLYVSHDAPHLGAHVPPGLLYMARHTLNELIKTPGAVVGITLTSGDFPVDRVKKLIDQPAVKQLLINYVDKNYAISNTEHNTWQNKLQNMGYPQQTRNIALSNGSHCADDQGLYSNEQLLKIAGSGSTKFLGDVLLQITGLGFVPGVALGNLESALLGFLPGRSKVSADFQVNAFSTSGNAQLYKGKITYKKTFLWILPITVTITNKSFNYSSSLFLDNFPGGLNPSSKLIDDINSSGNNWLYRYDFTVESNLDFGFIPVVSALDVGSGSTTLYTSDYTKVYTAASPPTGSKSIPFHNFATSTNTSGENEIHLSFNRRNGDWLADELDTDTSTTIFDCSFICSSTNSITGPSDLCTASVYSVNLPSGIGVYWSVSPSSAGSVSQNGTSTTFTPSTSYSGIATLKASLSSYSCGSSEITKTVNISSRNLVVYADYFSDGTFINIFADVSGGEPPYSWYIDNVLQLTTNVPFARLSRRCSTIDPSFELSVMSVGPCGKSRGSVFISEVCDGGIFPQYLAIYPNPASEELTIAKLDTQQSSGSSDQDTTTIDFENEEITVRVYDFYGQTVIDKTFKNLEKAHKLNLNRLKDGIYTMKIVGQKINETHQLVIQKK